jgi:hypothetical protein
VAALAQILAQERADNEATANAGASGAAAAAAVRIEIYTYIHTIVLVSPEEGEFKRRGH